LPYRRVDEEGLIRFILELEEPENDFETGPELSIFNDCNLSPFSDTNGDGFGQGWLLLINVFFRQNFLFSVHKFSLDVLLTTCYVTS